MKVQVIRLSLPEGKTKTENKQKGGGGKEAHQEKGDAN